MQVKGEDTLILYIFFFSKEYVILQYRKNKKPKLEQKTTFTQLEIVRPLKHCITAVNILFNSRVLN